jgi:hypothetical protein
MVADHSAFCRSEVSILFQVCCRTNSTYLSTNGGQISIIILSQFLLMTNQSLLSFIFLFFLLIFQTLLSHSLSHPRFIYILEIYKPPPLPLSAISFFLQSVRQVEAFHGDDCVTDRGLQNGGRGGEGPAILVPIPPVYSSMM